mmetsp:Transcript_9970/g.16686  ORF Transcript_9970/g.16686 Transcript_9970/m.16686 type:complete len:214 (+) Transcript_9970:167-808(+)
MNYFLEAIVTFVASAFALVPTTSTTGTTGTTGAVGGDRGLKLFRHRVQDPQSSSPGRDGCMSLAVLNAIFALIQGNVEEDAPRTWTVGKVQPLLSLLLCQVAAVDDHGTYTCCTCTCTCTCLVSASDSSQCIIQSVFTLAFPSHFILVDTVEKAWLCMHECVGEGTLAGCCEPAQHEERGHPHGTRSSLLVLQRRPHCCCCCCCCCCCNGGWC